MAFARFFFFIRKRLDIIIMFQSSPYCIDFSFTGITNDSKDPSVDTYRSTTLPLLKRFGVSAEGLDLKIESRGVSPEGGGEVLLSVPIVQSLNVGVFCSAVFFLTSLFRLLYYSLLFDLQAVTWTDEGMVKRIRGHTFSTRVSSQYENTMLHAARGVFNRLLPDVHIFTDHRVGAQAGKYVFFLF